MAQEKVLDIVKSTKSILTPYNVASDGKITSSKNAGLENMDDVYAQRMVLSGSQGYFQAGKKDRDINDQKMMFSGWFGTPLTMSKFSMANGVNPQVQWGSTNHDILHRGNLPTAGDIGAVAKSGDSMIGQLILTPSFVDTSNNAQLAHIGKDATKPLYIRNMREHNSSAWLWEKVYNGSLYYSSGTNGSGTSKIRLQVSGSGEIYLGANADKRVYHEGFKPTAADVGAVAKAGDSMTGRLLIEGRNSAGSFGVKRLNSTQFANYGQSGDTGGEAIIGVGPTAEDFVAYLKVGVNKLTFQGGSGDFQGGSGDFQGGSGEKKVYHEGFKPTPAEVGAVNKTGDTMTGNLTAPKVLLSAAQGTEVNSAARRDFVISECAKQVTKSGDTMTGNLTAPKVLLSSAQGTEANSSTRKDYVDGLISKLRDDINKGMEQLTTVGSWPGV